MDFGCQNAPSADELLLGNDLTINSSTNETDLDDSQRELLVEEAKRPFEISRKHFARRTSIPAPPADPIDCRSLADGSLTAVTATIINPDSSTTTRNLVSGFSIHLPGQDG
ncbi:unnamed protein product [Zymoseptoria tritici ST99CH_1A5]|uniref:Uncharacterized protein n=1 Tax=Zymoseptoria tritici ST99CH_1A5 TaxID=1276529 RepID=A0A1Y6LW97_ZYMTR|nr:unnamed protein product [Zymoseptoria tritici ST99CH_1A5]